MCIKSEHLRMSMTLDINNMADQTDANQSPQKDASQEELLKAAQDQLAQVMNKAMENVADNPDGRQEEVVYEEDVDYVEPMQDPYNKAIKYLENHNILQLFQQLTASIVYTKPERPLEYMMREVERMKIEKENEQGKK